jgi:8-oxo-dGTP pyrophosphatase MutT (NUDIX family)
MGDQRTANRPLSLTPSNRLARLRDRLAEHHPVRDDDPTLIWAAVAVIMVPDPDAVLLIRRAEREGDPWGGHMALPGGRRELGDSDLLATAIRESREEVGITIERELSAGALDDVVPRTPVLPPIAVRPFVFVAAYRPALTLNHEVAVAHWVSLDHLLNPATRHPVRLEVAGQGRTVQAYELEDAIVWGMTERILSNLLFHLT